MAQQITKRKVTPTYKQMAFETAVRNPERYKSILTAIVPFVNKILDDAQLLKLVSSLYLGGIVSSDGVEINEDSTIDSISDSIISVNSTRKADGGFPEGYQSRFWTYMRTLSELGFVYARYGEHLKLSKIALMLINNEIDEQEAFSLQAMKYNRKSPYRNILNDFNYFNFILEVLKQRGRISYEQFIISTFCKDGDINDFLSIIDNNTFGDLRDVEKFVRKEYGTTLQAQTILRDYPDVVLRLLIITGFVSIQFRGKVFIYRNIANDEYINDLLNLKIELSVEEKSNTELHFNKLETHNKTLLKIVFKHRAEIPETDGFEYVKKVGQIIALYELSEDTVIESIKHIGTSKNVIPAFKYIAEPLKLEFFLSLILAIKYGKEFAVKPNYKSDYMGLPISHAPGFKGDIEVYSTKLYWLIEVTLIRNKTQQLNSETTSVIRHFLEDNKVNQYFSKYLSFVAPVIHTDTKDYFDYAVVRHRIKERNFNLKPYSISEFVAITLAKQNFEDMEDYSTQVINDFKKNFN
ncbi:MAG: AlwI family type II restriction endonuclease [Saprospiraceae bacterium]|nr:AlwI family type II restriction endonuclease [Saprospiraceae bacterium]